MECVNFTTLCCKGVLWCGGVCGVHCEEGIWGCERVMWRCGWDIRSCRHYVGLVREYVWSWGSGMWSSESVGSGIFPSLVTMVLDHVDLRSSHDFNWRGSCRVHDPSKLRTVHFTEGRQYYSPQSAATITRNKKRKKLHPSGPALTATSVVAYVKLRYVAALWVPSHELYGKKLHRRKSRH